MDLAQRVLVGTAPGRLTAVVGRPASGVSGLLSKVVSAAASNGDGTRAVLASWERSATRSIEAIGTGLVAVPEIIDWNVDELARCRELVHAPEGTVVAVDYRAFAPAVNSVSVLVVLSNGSRHSATVARRAPAGHWSSVETVER